MIAEIVWEEKIIRDRQIDRERERFREKRECVSDRQKYADYFQIYNCNYRIKMEACFTAFDKDE